MKTLKFLQLKNRNPGGRQTRHSFAFFRTQDEGISNVPPPPPKPEKEKTTLKTYLSKRRNKREATSREVRASAVELVTINELKEEIQQREVTLVALDKRIKSIESERERTRVELTDAQTQLKDRVQEVSGLEKLLSERDQTIDQLTEMANKIKKEKSFLQIEFDKTKSELKVRESEIRNLNFSLLECAHDLQAAKTDLSATISEKDHALHEIQQRLSEREKLERTQTNQIVSLQQELESVQQDLRNAQSELEATRSMCDAEIEAAQAMCTAEIEATKAKCTAELGVIKAKYAAELHVAKEEHADELEATKAQLSFVKSQLDSTKAQLSFTKSKLEWAKADLSSIKSLLDSAKAELANTNNKFKRTTAELESSKEEIEKYVEMMAYRDGLTSLIITVYQEDIQVEKERSNEELEEKQDQISKMKTSYEKEKKTNAKTIKQLTNQVQNLTNSQVQEKARAYQLESENIKLRKQLEQSKTHVDDVELMKEEIARLQAENITLKITPKRKDSISDVANKIRSSFVPATPPESPCNSRPSSDAFSIVHEGILEDATEGNSIVTNGDWVTVRKRGSKSRRGSIRLRTGSRGGRKF